VRAKVNINAGICGFQTIAQVESSDEQLVTFQIESNCEKIKALAQKLVQTEPLDAFQEISSQGKSQLLTLSQDHLPVCCAACAVPIGLFKAMQVAAGLALPKEVSIRLEKDCD
jgi:hypothetical protein